jgi:DNA helicase HerA-like ATPase
VLFIDEAHNVVPEAEASVSTTVLRELARMGRHSRTGLILASQSPADLDASILKRLQTRFIFALERDQLKSIGGVRSDLGDELVDALPKLGRGICAVSGNGDQIRHGFLMKVLERRTPVGGGTPPVFAGRVKRALEDCR